MIKEYFYKKKMEKYKIMLGKALTILFVLGISGIILGLPGCVVYHVYQQEQEKINRPNLTYNIAIIRPDGTIHDQFKIKSRYNPYIYVDEGQAFLRYAHQGEDSNYRNHIPNGWKAEVSPPEIEL